MAPNNTSLNVHEANDEQEPLLATVSHISTTDTNPSKRLDSKATDGELGTKSLTLVMCSVWIGTFSAGLGRISVSVI